MSAEGTAWAKAIIAKRRDLSASVQRTLLFLGKSHNKNTGWATASYAQISAGTRDARRTVIDAVSIIEAEGWAEKKANRKGQRQGANGYFLRMGQSANLHPEKASSGCSRQSPETGAATAPSENPQGAVAAPPNARARTRSRESHGWRAQPLRSAGGYYA